MIEDFRRMKTGIDWHAFGGVIGTSTAVIMQNFSTFAAGLAATATALYMLFRIGREWRAMKRESEAGEGPDCQNFAPVKKKKKHHDENED